ncbi:hypothetical protein ACET3Z_011070 [Daucus carota]
MAMHWIPPPQGSLKINVHGVALCIPSPHTKDSRMGAVYRDSVGGLHLMTILALGQVAGPQMTKTDVDSDEEQHDLDGVVEEQFQDGGAANPGLLFMVEADLD